MQTLLFIIGICNGRDYIIIGAVVFTEKQLYLLMKRIRNADMQMRQILVQL